MKQNNGFIHLLMILILILITITCLFFVYWIFADRKIEEVSNQNSVTNQTENIVSQETEDLQEEMITASNLFYVQLDENAKIMYKALEKHKDDMKSGNYRIEFGEQFSELLKQEGGEEELNQSFQSAWNAYRFDNMDVFYIDVQKIFLFTKTTVFSGKTTYEVSLGANEGENYLLPQFENRQAVESAEEQIQAIVYDVAKRAQGTNIQKIQFVHDWMIDSMEYEQNAQSNSNAYDIYGAVIEKSTVCEGYARTFKLLMDQLEIPCLLIAGTGVNSNGETESHAWNQVHVNGTWYAVDVTWDDPVIIGNGNLPEGRKYQYFLKGSDEFYKTHTKSGVLSENSMEFLYPDLAKENFEF